MGNTSSKCEDLKKQKDKNEAELKEIQEELHNKRKLVDEQKKEIQVDTVFVYVLNQALISEINFFPLLTFGEFGKIRDIS